MAGLDPTETGNELSLPTSEFTTLTMHVQHTLREGEAPAIRQRHYQSVGLLFSSRVLLLSNIRSPNVLSPMRSITFSCLLWF